MFDSGVELPAVLTARLAGLIEQNHAELKAAECRTLQLACAWADAHYLDSGSDEYQPLIHGPGPGAGKAPRKFRNTAPPNSAPSTAQGSWRPER